MTKCFECSREVSDAYAGKYLSNKNNQRELSVDGEVQVRCARCHITFLEKHVDMLGMCLDILKGKVANNISNLLSIKSLVDEVCDGEQETPEACE